LERRVSRRRPERSERTVSDRILIIEDEQTVADIIAINLRIETFEVDVALNGTAGSPAPARVTSTSSSATS